MKQRFGIELDEQGMVILSSKQLQEIEANAELVTAGAGTNSSNCGGTNDVCRNTGGCDGSTNATCTNGSYGYRCKNVKPV